MRRLRLPIAITLAALILSAALMRCSEGAPAARSAPPPAFPRGMTAEDWRRVQSRRTLALAAAATPPSPGVPAAPPAPRDPFLAALPASPDQPLVVLEANALRHSRLGELFIRCVVQPGGEDRLAEFRGESGIDPLKDIDRIAFSRDGVVVSGFFEGARFDRLEADSQAESYGERGRVFRPRAGEAQQVALGTWGTQLMALGPDGFVKGALDRVEGRAAATSPAFGEDLTYGEAYGVIPGAALAPLLRGTRGDLGERLAALAKRIELHADAMNDVAVVARVSGDDPSGLDDLAASIGTALSLARLQAKASGSSGLADVLEHARVERGARGFSVEVAIPADVLERWFEGCGEAPGQP